jgi:hypothetical protein
VGLEGKDCIAHSVVSLSVVVCTFY